MGLIVLWRSRSLRIGLVALVLFGAGGLIASRAWGGGWPAAEAASTNPWPSFVMTYQETSSRGPNGASVVAQARFEYTDNLHWRLTILQSPTMPEYAGWSDKLNGYQLTTHDSRSGRDTVNQLPQDGIQAAADWLVPGAVQTWVNQPGTTITVSINGLATASRQAPWNGSLLTKQITYRLADFIPMEVIETSDGHETRHIDVQQFQLTVR